MAAGVNLSPINSSRKRFATDFYGKFNGEPLRAAVENVKFEREARAKTLAAPQNKFDPNANLNRIKNLTVQAVRAANQTLANFTRLEAPKWASNLASNLTKRP